MDNKDRLLLMHLQIGLKLESRPYETLAKKIGCDVVEVFLRTQHFKEEKNIRQISGVIDLRKLGYQNALVAMSVAAPQMGHAVEFLRKHPAVSFVFDVRNEFNLWFNLSLPRGFALDEHVSYLHKAAHSEKTFLLPVIKAFRADLRRVSMIRSYDERGCIDLDENELKVLRSLQGDLPLTDMPFKRLAQTVEMTEESFLATARELIRKKVIKRIGALGPVRQEKARVKALLMWNVPEERETEIAAEIVITPGVLNCTKRPISDKFPYSLYAMVRTSGMEEALEIVGKIEERIGKWPRQILGIEKEYKRVSLEYFTEELDAWTKKAKMLQSF